MSTAVKAGPRSGKTLLTSPFVQQYLHPRTSPQNSLVLDPSTLLAFLVKYVENGQWDAAIKSETELPGRKSPNPRLTFWETFALRLECPFLAYHLNVHLMSTHALPISIYWALSLNLFFPSYEWTWPDSSVYGDRASARAGRWGSPGISRKKRENSSLSFKSLGYLIKSFKSLSIYCMKWDLRKKHTKFKNQSGWKQINCEWIHSPVN